jgi:hypothetical protein
MPEEKKDVYERQTAAHQENIPLLPETLMADIIESVKNCAEDFTDVTKNNLTDTQRRRKVGAGTGNYGFIDKVSDLAEENAQFVQFFKLADLKNCLRNVETCLNLAALLIGFYQAVTNTMMVYSDDAYSMALIFYNNVKEMQRRGDPMAVSLYRILKTYFKKTKSVSAEPTEKEQQKHVNALIHGKKDGTFSIENISPKTTAGVHKVVDNTRTGKAEFKESEERSVRE